MSTEAIYNMSGLTYQGDLDDFWSHASPPDKNLKEQFLNYVIQKTQIVGCFYGRIENDLNSMFEFE